MLRRPWSRYLAHLQIAHVGLRQRFSESRISRLVHESGQAVRIDDYAAMTRGDSGRPGSLRRRCADHGGRSAVGHDRGLLAPRGFPAPDTEARLTAFTELAATAIANAQAQADLAASRARIVASADETRRRIERDLHDGAQAQLVTLVLQLRAAQAVVPPMTWSRRSSTASRPG